MDMSRLVQRALLSCTIRYMYVCLAARDEEAFEAIISSRGHLKKSAQTAMQPDTAHTATQIPKVAEYEGSDTVSEN